MGKTVTFILGNGFDIGFGLPTKYTDFYPIYTRCSGLKEEQNIRLFKKNICREKYQYWADFEQAFGLYAKNCNDAGKYSSCLFDFASKFNEYLQGVMCRCTFACFEAEIAERMHSAVNTYGRSNNIIPRLPQPELPHENIKCHFITLNYTPTIDYATKYLKKRLRDINAEPNIEVGEVVHLHGRINSIIMGVNDSSQIDNEKLRHSEEIKRSILKPGQITQLNTGTDTKTEKLIQESDEICIYGASMGKTDKKWWNCIAQWLKNNQNHKLYILTYRDTPLSIAQDLILCRDKVCRNFWNVTDFFFSEERERMKKQIYVGLNHNVFRMDDMGIYRK